LKRFLHLFVAIGFQKRKKSSRYTTDTNSIDKKAHLLVLDATADQQVKFNKSIGPS
jgi:hypothetical protein